MRAILLAGMPSVTLTDAAAMRLQSISFFLLVFLLVSLAVRAIWNGLRSDFPRLPRLSYPKALGLVGLWGLLFLLVLTMISGARELMTPGAWKKDGLTYTLDRKPDPATEPADTARRESMRALANVLAAYAAGHDGRYPASADDPAIPAAVWKTLHPSGAKYLYFPGRTTRDAGRVLACEPELYDDGRLVLFADGEIKRLTSDGIAPLVAGGK